jgi:electron transport complex protein RnfA
LTVRSDCENTEPGAAHEADAAREVIMNLLVIVLLAMLTENFVLSKFLGICPFLGVSRRMSTAGGMSMAVQKMSPGLYQALGIFLPLITTNCAVLGLAVLNVQRGYSLLEVLVHSVGAAAGFALALMLFAGLREKMEGSAVPRAFQGAAIALVTAGILSLAFMGFSGLAPSN